MKKFISLIAALLTLQAMPASAIVGGPWDNDNFDPLNQGTYQAALFLRNGVGMARFQNDAGHQFSRFNQSVIYYRGIVYTGTCFGFIDHQSDLVIGITNGDTNNTVIVENQVGLTPGLPFNALTGTVDSGEGRNIQRCNTSWQCRITDDAPILRFEGDGEARFFGDLSTFEEITNTTNTTIIGDTTIDTDTTFSDFGGEDDTFPDVGVRAKLWAFGSQISISSLSSF